MDSKQGYWLEGVVVVVVTCAMVVGVRGWPKLDDATSQVWAGWVQAIGSIAAILAAVAVASRQVRSARAQSIEAERREIANILQALRDEIEALWEGFEKTFGGRLSRSEPGKVFEFWWPSPEDPFVVYRSSAGKIGQIDNHDLRRAIVRVYARAEGMLVTVRTHNALLLTLRAARDAFEEDKTRLNWKRVKRAERAIISYGDTMRALYLDMDGLIKDALRLLPDRAIGGPMR